MTPGHHTHHSLQNATRPIVAVSACLLGHEVRYDGGQKRHEFVAQALVQWLELLPVCPEVEAGLGVPRPPVHLVQCNGGVKAVGVADPGLDVTQKLNRYGAERVQRLQHIDAYIFKARSPSCGVSSTPIRFSDGRDRKGAGLFAAQVMQSLPLLPVVEEQKLDSPAQQINFLQRIAAYRRWRDFVSAKRYWDDLLQFHAANRLLLLSHGAEGLRRLGRWIEEQRCNGRLGESQLQRYGEQYMAQFGRQATRRRHAIALRRIARVAVEAKCLRPLIADYQACNLSLCTIMQFFSNELSSHCLTDPGIQNYLQSCSEPGLSELM